MYNSKKKNLFSDDLLKTSKNNRYYYDFGTGKKVEREEVKKERDAFLEGFNGTKTTAEKKESNPLIFEEPKSTYQPYKPSKETTYQTRSFSPKRSEALAKATEEKQKNTWLPYLGGDLSSDMDKETFLDGFIEQSNIQIQSRPSNDALSRSLTNPNGEKKTTNLGRSNDFDAHVSLYDTAHKQYPWMRVASKLSPVAAEVIDNRITTSSAKVSKHSDIINDVSNRYKVPSEIIGGIIFKEQLTKSLPDTFANIHTSITKENHSTGLGAIFPETARAAWSKVDAQRELPKTDAELQYKLTHDKQFNIETIAAVLLYEAERNGFIPDVSEASNLTTDQWWKAVAKYNGSDEYARKVYEYLPYITELLD